MKKSAPDEIQENTQPCMALQEFCDMEQLYMLLDNWSRSTGMSAVIVDAEGTPTSEKFGMTEFCSMIHANENGRKSCAATWKENHDGIYVCPVGFYDFSIPIILPDGQVLGRVLAGQVLSANQDVDDVFSRTVGLGIEGAQAKDVLSRVHKKTQTEMEGAYKLLKEMLRFFVEKNYSIWKTRHELDKAPARLDRILSQITQIMYSYNLTVDLATDTYTLITGTGMERTVEEYRKHGRQSELKAYQNSIIHPAYSARFNNLTDFEDVRNDPTVNGFRGSLEYPVLYPGDEEYEWHEINVFIDTEEDGRRIANILGRDITETHNAQERNEKELRAAAAKNEILSELTKMLYSYNATVNLNTGKYSLIVGTGMEELIQHFSRTDDYEKACEYLLEKAVPEYLEEMNRRFSLQSLREQKHLRGHIGQMEYAAVTNNGIGWFEVNAFMGVDEEGTPTANILGREVTEAHDKADTKVQLEIANAASAAKSAFLFNMSHDIRTPMNAIIGFTELLDKHIDNPVLVKNYVDKIRISSDFLLSLINNVLEMARIESGKETLDETRWNLHLFNDTLFALFDSQMKEKGITFKRNLQVEHADVLVDETKLREIFLNILSNALKYTPAGGTVTMDLTELPSNRPGYAMYQTVITDTGVGMAEDFIPHIFEEFTRERSSTESRVNGTGLGMPIVKKLVDLMQGTIEVESRIGKGTRITVTLSHRIAEGNKVCQPPEEVMGYQTGCFAGKRILLAEDNELNAEIAITILEEAGFLVERAEDGVICLDMLEKAAPDYYDLILMDIQMPNMDGYKATQTIRKFADQKKAGITIIAMTANAFEEDRRNAFLAGMNGHIAKPIRVEQLLSILTESLK